MKLKLRKIGNSQGVYLPKEMVSNYNIGDYVDLEVVDKASVITSLQEKIQNIEQGNYKKAEEPDNVITDDIELEPDDSVKKQVEFIN